MVDAHAIGIVTSIANTQQFPLPIVIQCLHHGLYSCILTPCMLTPSLQLPHYLYRQEDSTIAGQQAIIFAKPNQMMDIPMSNPPLIHAFFLGRATAEVFTEDLTDALSNFGKFDAEQQQRLQQFPNRVMERAQAEEDRVMQGEPGPASAASPPETDDLQKTLHELRQEIAYLRTALRSYNGHTS